MINDSQGIRRIINHMNKLIINVNIFFIIYKLLEVIDTNCVRDLVTVKLFSRL